MQQSFLTFYKQVGAWGFGNPCLVLQEEAQVSSDTDTEEEYTKTRKK